MKKISLILAGIAAAVGLDFIMVGDYGWIPDMTIPDHTFTVLDGYVGSL